MEPSLVKQTKISKVLTLLIIWISLIVCVTSCLKACWSHSCFQALMFRLCWLKNWWFNQHLNWRLRCFQSLQLNWHFMSFLHAQHLLIFSRCFSCLQLLSVNQRFISSVTFCLTSAALMLTVSLMFIFIFDFLCQFHLSRNFFSLSFSRYVYKLLGCAGFLIHI